MSWIILSLISFTFLSSRTQRTHSDLSRQARIPAHTSHSKQGLSCTHTTHQLSFPPPHGCFPRLAEQFAKLNFTFFYLQGFAIFFLLRSRVDSILWNKVERVWWQSKDSCMRLRNWLVYMYQGTKQSTLGAALPVSSTKNSTKKSLRAFENHGGSTRPLRCWSTKIWASFTECKMMYIKLQ